MTAILSQKIKNMGILCACLVVSIHSGVPSNPPLSSYWFVRQLIVDGVASIAVPFFFAVSGFLLARHLGEVSWWQREIAKRIKTLLIPYIMWSLIAALASLPLSVIADVIAYRPLGTSIYFIHGTNWLTILGLNLRDYPLNYPLWYVRCLIVLVLASYFLNLMLTRFKYTWLAGLFLIHLSIGFFQLSGWTTSLGHITCGLFYFSLGMALWMKERLLNVSLYLTVASGVLWLIMLMTKMYVACHEGGQIVGLIGKMAIPFLLYFTWSVMPSLELPGGITSNAFPIYLMHAIITGYIKCLLDFLGLGPMTISVIRFVGSIACSCAIALFLHRFLPKSYSFLFGGRK